MKQLGMIALMLVLANAAAASTVEDCEAQFEAGNAAYEAGSFAEAAEAYEAVLAECRSFEAEYNLANASFKLGQIGRSILHYERALQLDPNNDDARANLQLANTKVTDRIEPLPTQGLRDLWERVVAKGRLGFWSVTLLVLWLGGFGALSWRLLAREEAMRRIATTMAAVLLALSVGAGFLFSATLHRDDMSHEAVILTPTAEIRNAPQTTNSLVLFILHEGTKGRILSRTSDWIELEFANGSVGWVAAGQVAEV